MEFKIIFQEIWDFVLSFEDWSGKNMFSTFRDDREESAFLNDMTDSRVKLTTSLQSQKKNRIKTHSTTKGTTNVEFSPFDDEISFRGYLSQLDCEILNIEVVSQTGLLSLQNSNIKKTSYDLKGISSDGSVKISLINECQEIKNNFSTLEGKINVNRTPSLRQLGEESVLNEDEIYFCVHLTKIDIKSYPSFVEHPVNLYVTIEWVNI